MSAFVLIPGAGGTAWYWSRVVPLLREAGHDVVAVDLPGDDENAGLPEYAGLVETAIDRRDGVVLVAQSLGGFTAAMVSARVRLGELVFVNAMIPAPGGTPGSWWQETGWEQARLSAAIAGGYSTEFDLDEYFLHDVPPDVAAEGEPYQRAEADAVFGSHCDFTDWPDIPVRVLSGTEDRFFPLEFQRRLARERLGVKPDVLPGGHLLALSNPRGVVDYLLRR
ncbi:MAG TPA: alpha/beta hydrolase [Arthrobacter sp.]|nr:alpha/beta hydrolase [Arthrobacter sp.]